MQKTVLAVLLATLCLSGCNKSPAPKESPSSSTPTPAPTASVPKHDDAVQKKLQDLAGTSATDCGRPDSQAEGILKAASDCAMQGAQQKHAFYVAYDMPGMTVGVAGDSSGKLSTVQSQGASGSIASGDCPAQLRVAPSGRVTCFTPGDMGSMGVGAHSGSGMPAGVANPHGGKMPATKPK